MARVKALVISADPDFRRRVRVALGGAVPGDDGPWEHLEAADGIRGIATARREQPDLVVADEIASGAGAFAVARELRGAARPFPGAIVVVLARRHDAWLARWAGADAWVVHPIDPFALADTVRELVEKRRGSEAT